MPIGPLVAAIGALLLIVSLCLDWYEGLTGFTVFEFLDLLLVVLALLTLASLAVAVGFLRTALRPGTPLVVSVLALLIVLSQLVNHPPAALELDPDTGLWLALAGAALMVAGAVLSTAHIALAVEPRTRAAATPAATRVDEPPTVSVQPPTDRL